MTNKIEKNNVIQLKDCTEGLRDNDAFICELEVTMETISTLSGLELSIMPCGYEGLYSLSELSHGSRDKYFSNPGLSETLLIEKSLEQIHLYLLGTLEGIFAMETKRIRTENTRRELAALAEKIDKKGAKNDY